MAAERKTGRRAGPPPPPDVASRPGLANRGFRSLDPERQREVADDGGQATPGGGNAKHEGGNAPRGTARDRSRRPAPRVDPDRTQD